MTGPTLLPVDVVAVLTDLQQQVSDLTAVLEAQQSNLSDLTLIVQSQDYALTQLLPVRERRSVAPASPVRPGGR